MTAARAGSAPPLARRLDLLGVMVVLMVVATIFNDLFPVLPLGELSKEGFVYVFPAVVLVFFFAGPVGRIGFPPVLVALSVGLLVTIVLGVVLNFDDIVSASFKGKTGMTRVLTQGMSVAFGILITLLSYNLTADGRGIWIARGARVALLVMAAVGFFEFASWFSIPGLTQVHNAISAVIHENPEYADRLRSTAFEVSWTAVMLTFLFPFAIADSEMPAWKVAFYVALVVVIVVLAQSRTAILVVGVQGMMLAWAFFKRRIDLLVHALALGTIGLAAILVVGVGERITGPVANMLEYGSFAGNTQSTEENVSNVTRLAAVRAGLAMFEEQPVFGVGLGQYGFKYPGQLRAEDLRSWEVRNFVDGAHPNWPPAFSIHARMLAETGVVGYLIWLALVVPLLVRSIRRANVATAEGRMHLAAAMTLAGWLLLGFSIDSFRFFGGWIAIGVAFGLLERPEPRSAGRTIASRSY